MNKTVDILNEEMSKMQNILKSEKKPNTKEVEKVNPLIKKII